MLTMAVPTVMTVAVPTVVPKMSMAQMQLRMQGPDMIAVHSRHVVVAFYVHWARRWLVVVVVLDNAPLNKWRFFNHRRPGLAVHWTFQVCSTCWVSEQQSQGKGKQR